MDLKIKPSLTLPRRLFLFFGSLLLLYPLIRFINHRLPRKPQIVEVNNALNPGGFLAKEEFILFSSGDKTWAVSRTCTHLGCRLNYKEDQGFLECPCHQSRFTIEGAVLRGPAKRSLPVFKVEIKNGAPPTYIVTIQ